MAVAEDATALARAFEAARSRAERAFASAAVFLERYLPHARHVEVQILGLADGRVVALGERDCSVQRRHQKVAEEAPSPAVPEALRQRMCDAAVRAGEAVGYRGAGTVECLVDGRSEQFVFLEMNTRIQVEHPVTEMITGIDIVREQLTIASGHKLSHAQKDVELRGHAIECRINAEDPKDFMPSPGPIKLWHPPGGPGIRVDSHVYSGYSVPPYYDSMIGKLIAYGETRRTAIARMNNALNEIVVEGIKTNIPLHREICHHAAFQTGGTDIHYLEKRLGL